jgi:hypothetical protein
MLLRTGRGSFQFGRARPHGRTAALELLRQIAESEAGQRYLTSILAEEVPKDDLAAMSDEEITHALAARITSGKLAFVHLRPAESRAEGFPVEDDDASVVIGPTNKEAKSYPAPEVPPEYIVLARVESDEVIGSTAYLSAELAALLFVMFARQKVPSTIAPTYVSVSSDEAHKVGASQNSIDASLNGEIYAGGDFKRPESAVPSTFVTVADETASTTKNTTDALVGAFSAMFAPQPFVRTRAAVSDEEGGA